MRRLWTRYTNRFGDWMDRPSSGVIIILMLIVLMLVTPAPTGDFYCWPNPDKPGRDNDWCQYVHRPDSKDAALRVGMLPVTFDKVTRQ